MEGWRREGSAYDEILALAPQQAHSVASLAMLPMLPKSPMLVGMLLIVSSVMFLMQLT